MRQGLVTNGQIFRLTNDDDCDDKWSTFTVTLPTFLGTIAVLRYRQLYE